MTIHTEPIPFWASLVSGGCAGTSVDLILYPLDTIKTRLQSSAGFFRSGGFTGVYRGVSAAALGSAPSAALFFLTYDSLRQFLNDAHSQFHPTVTEIASASVAEIAACVVRVPTENVKQKMQVGQFGGFKETLRYVVGSGGLFRGFSTTCLREAPFSALQFPLYEELRRRVQGEGEISPLASAACGSVAGGVAAGVTTPLDVVKTRQMLETHSGGLRSILMQIYREEGAKALLSGILPRMAWISIGGFVFFGTYEAVKHSIVF